MALALDVTYGGLPALRHDFEQQLKLGGLFVDGVDASALPPLAPVSLCIRITDMVQTLHAEARLTVATAQSACIEIAPAALSALSAAVEALTDGVAPAPGTRRAMVVDDADASSDEAHAVSPDGDAAADDATAQSNCATAPEGDDTRGHISLDRRVALMSAAEKVQLALHGDRAARQLLMRDRAGVVQSSLVRNPRFSLDEAQALARAPQLSPETADVLAQHPSFGASPQVALALVRNPRTPLPTVTQLLPRLSASDLRVVAKGLGVRSQVAAAARKRLLDGERR